jgi:hypothetical protein
MVIREVRKIGVFFISGLSSICDKLQLIFARFPGVLKKVHGFSTGAARGVTLHTLKREPQV